MRYTAQCPPSTWRHPTTVDQHCHGLHHFMKEGDLNHINETRYNLSQDGDSQIVYCSFWGKGYNNIPADTIFKDFFLSNISVYLIIFMLFYVYGFFACMYICLYLMYVVSAEARKS